MQSRAQVAPAEFPRSEAGFALILAIIALMLLTFLGLTLTLSTTTETQIARNYTWSRQAFYNAQAGIAAARAALNAFPRNPTTGAADWSPAMWTARVNTGMTSVPAGAAAGRDWEGNLCDSTTTIYGKNNTGYGKIFAAGGTRYENMTAVPGAPGLSLSGAVTVWIRRVTQWQTGVTPQRMEDLPDNGRAVLTAEGVAPFRAGDLSNGDLRRQQQAVQIIEVEVADAAQSQTVVNVANHGQAGGGANGSGFGQGSPIQSGGLAGGTDTGIGVQ